MCMSELPLIKLDLSLFTALVNLTSLRSLDLSENMIDSVLAIYKSLGAVQM